MPNPINNMEIYDFFNLNQALKKNIISNSNLLPTLRYLKDFLNTKISMFEYENLPEPLTSQIVESMMAFNNRLCWYNSSVLGVILCSYIPDSNYDIYMKPETVTLKGLNGVTIKTNVKFSDIVLCLDNTMDIIPYLTILEYINRMVEIEGTLSVNLSWLKLPAMWTIPSKDGLKDVKEIIKKSCNFEPFAILDDSIGATFKQNDLKLPVEPESLIEIYKNYKNWCTESYGISGNASQKKERLLVGEVASQSDYSDTVYDDMRRNRANWVKLVNEKFGCNIKLIERYAIRQKEQLEIQMLMAKSLQGGNIKNDNT